MAERSQNTYSPFTGDVSRNVAGMVIAVIKEYMSVGLQGSCILFLDPDRFDLTVGGRRRLF
jgi:hypothetical protein